MFVLDTDLRRLTLGAIVLPLGIALAACSAGAEIGHPTPPQEAPTFPTESVAGIPAPTLPPAEFANAIAITYELNRIEVGPSESCPISSEEKLIVFSESVYANGAGDTLWVGQTELHPGDKFVGPDKHELEQLVTCNGKQWPAIHVVRPGVTLSE